MRHWLPKLERYSLSTLFSWESKPTFQRESLLSRQSCDISHKRVSFLVTSLGLRLCVRRLNFCTLEAATGFTNIGGFSGSCADGSRKLWAKKKRSICTGHPQQIYEALWEGMRLLSRPKLSFYTGLSDKYIHIYIVICTDKYIYIICICTCFWTWWCFMHVWSSIRMASCWKMFEVHRSSLSSQRKPTHHPKKTFNIFCWIAKSKNRWTFIRESHISGWFWDVRKVSNLICFCVFSLHFPLHLPEDILTLTNSGPSKFEDRYQTKWWCGNVSAFKYTQILGINVRLQGGIYTSTVISSDLSTYILGDVEVTLLGEVVVARWCQWT